MNVLVPNTSIFGLEIAEWTRKAPFCPNFYNSIKPICKYTEPKLRHMGLEEALLVGLEPTTFIIKCEYLICATIVLLASRVTELIPENVVGFH